MCTKSRPSYRSFHDYVAAVMHHMPQAPRSVFRRHLSPVRALVCQPACFHDVPIASLPFVQVHEEMHSEYKCVEIRFLYCSLL